MMNASGTKRKLGRAIRNSELYWRCWDNFRPWITYQLSVAKRSTMTERVLLSSLKRDGIGITSVEELLESPSLFHELDLQVGMLEEALAGQIAAAGKSKECSGFKTYLIELLGQRPVLDPSSIFVRFAVEPAVLNIAAAYLGMYPRLRFFNVWHNFASDARPRNSQLWHRDPEDRYILKMFVYLTDVDEESGPLVYARGTQNRGRVRCDPETFGEPDTTARRSTDEQMASVAPREGWATVTGRKGTIVFADTRGYHKGGLARGRDRIVYNCMFTSQASSRDEYFERAGALPHHLPTEVSFALGAN